MKRRVFDLIGQLDQSSTEAVAPEPDHETAQLFRSVETKFLAMNPDAWGERIHWQMRNASASI